MALWLLAISLAAAAADEAETWNAELPAGLGHFPGLPQHRHPSLAVIGVEKCGTTNLQGGIVAAWGGDLVNKPLLKELNYLDRPLQGRSGYLELLNVSAGLPYSIDASPSYVQMGGEGFLSSLQRRGLNADPGVILIMREPIGRAESMFNYISRISPGGYGILSRSFSDLVAFELDILEGPKLSPALKALLAPSADASMAAAAVALAEQEIKERSWNAGHTTYGRYFSPLLGSLYLVYMLTWRDYFLAAGNTAADNAGGKGGGVLIVDAQYFFADTVAFSREVLHPFLFGGPAAPGLSKEELEHLLALKERWGGPQGPAGSRRRLAQSELTPALACRLQTFYAPFLLRMRELLGEIEAAAARAFVVPSLRDERAWWREVPYCQEE